MALETKKELRNQILYSVFVRQFGEHGTFADVEADLPRIRALGTDVLWLLPIHPIGEQARKGGLGSPYAIRDYRAVNPEYGTLEDFRRLTDAVRAAGMKCMIDVVYNHTSPDSVLAAEHPEWFYHRPDGAPGNRIGDWTDVVDLDYGSAALWDYQIETLCFWAQYVDGFRCDVAPLVPLAFWQKARAAVERVRPGCLWLAESVEPEMIAATRAEGIACLSDAELFQAFDVTYEYDVYWDMIACLTGKGSLAAWAERLNRQESLYPENYVKLRMLENHDRPRAAALAPDGRALRNQTALTYFRKGMTLLYHGQEWSALRRPSLFERDPVRRGAGADLTEFLRRLARVRRHPLLRDGAFRCEDAGNGFLFAEYRSGGARLCGLFSLTGRPGAARVSLPDGVYENLLGGETFADCGLLRSEGEPLIFEV